MKHLIQSGIVLVAGVFGAAAATNHADHDPALRDKSSVRETILRRFLNKSHCPVESYAGAFIKEADANHLDWRLLPSLAIVESGGGRRDRRNNIFGWGNGVIGFASISDAIHHVAEALAEARPYRGKDLSGKLTAYNRNPGYYRAVTAVMERISPLPIAE